MIKKSFKQIVQEDVCKTFLNHDEFGDLHYVDGKPMTVIIDENENIEREKHVNRKLITDGIYIKQLLIYISAAEYGPLPALGKPFKLDNKLYRVVDAIDEDGLYSITLEANKS